MNDVIEQFRSAMLEYGITPPDTIIPDDKLHRFKRNGDKGGEKTGFYVLHLDSIASGHFGCWNPPFIKQNWCSKADSAMTEAERQAHQKHIADLKRKRKVEEKAMHAKARKECQQIWDESEQCPDDRPYVLAKGIIPYGAHVAPDGHQNIIVPIYVDGEIWSVQELNVNRWKKFHTDGKIQGGYMDIPESPNAPPETIVICEGWATGCSLYEATGYTVRVAFYAGNLMAVAKFTREKLPKARIILAADDDHRTTPNAGITNATAAAQAVGGVMVAPKFPDPANRPEKATDFNDLHQLIGGFEGIKAVHSQIEGAINKVATDASVAGDKTEWEEELAAHIEKMNRDHAQVLMGGKHMILIEKVEDGREILRFHSESDYRKLFRDKKIQIGIKSDGGALCKNPIDAWASHPDCRKYAGGVVFKPCIQLDDGDDRYNTWRGFTVKPIEGDWEKIRYHIHTIACKGNSTLSEYLLNWIAYTFQRPAEPAGTAIVLRGEQGTGKGLLGNFLMALWGVHGLHISNPKHLTGNFNAHLANTCFLFADEAFFAGDKSHEGTLKALITERTMTIERKGIDAVQQKNYLKVFMATNSDWAIPASSDGRRYFVSDTEEHQSREYYRDLNEAMEDERVQSAFLHAMLTRDIKGFHTGDIPESDALKDQRLHSMDSAGKWIIDSLHSGGFEYVDERGNCNAEPWKEEVEFATVFDSYKCWCDAQKIGEYGRLSQTAFGIRLNKWGFETRKKSSRNYRRMLTLEEAKRAIEAKEKIRIPD